MTSEPIIVRGHEEAEARFLAEWGSGRLHHGWLVEGPSGIGKSMLVRRLAVRLLGGDPDAPRDSVREKVTSQSHPDLRWVQREPDDKGKLPQDIAVSSMRELSRFFAMRPALGGARVGVLDSLDELNRFGSNAILKTLEEPPAGAVLFIIAHGTRPVLPTIRSRCRRLKLAPVSSDIVAQVLTQVAETPPHADIISLAAGRPGEALRLDSPEVRDAIKATQALLERWPRLEDRHIPVVLAAAAASDTAFEAACLQLLSCLRDRAVSGAPSVETARAATLWLETARDLARSRELKLEAGAVMASLIDRLQQQRAG